MASTSLTARVEARRHPAPIETFVSAAATTAPGDNTPPSSLVVAVGPPQVVLAQLRKSSPWTNDPKWFTKVILSPAALLKIMQHCQSGVAKGIAKGGNPVEVMGMLLGRPHTDRTLIVTDAFPLPIEGFETRVVADDQAVVNHMIQLGESLERTRSEKFMGWYHSHPFDLGSHSHCFLSQTDLSTQLQWQRAEDPHGNPFVAIVVDPLRSTHLQQPELKAFRAYPPDHTSPIPYECPDGTAEPIEQARLERWGSCWSRYYELSIECGTTPACRRVLEQLTQTYRWIRTFQAAPALPASQLATTVQQCHSAAAAASSATSSGPGSGRAPVVLRGGMGGSTSARGGRAAAASSAIAAPRGGLRPEQGLAALTVGTSASSSAPSSAASAALPLASSPSSSRPEWSKAVQKLVRLADDQSCDRHLQSAKQQIFG